MHTVLVSWVSPYVGWEGADDQGQLLGKLSREGPINKSGYFGHFLGKGLKEGERLARLGVVTRNKS